MERVIATLTTDEVTPAGTTVEIDGPGGGLFTTEPGNAPDQCFG